MFVCEVCKKPFKRESALHAHSQTCAGPIPSENTTSDTPAKPTMKQILEQHQRVRSGQSASIEPTEASKLEMKQLFKSAPKNRKAREHFAKSLSPEQYLMYLENQKDELAKKQYHLPKPIKNQSKTKIILDAESQTERPAFVMPVLRALPKSETL